tara:strand:+ start:84 stop:347 length:264 start_codon:yes stop_codon:yes gene_type:complete
METGDKGIPRVALAPTDESENIVILGKEKELWEQSNKETKYRVGIDAADPIELQQLSTNGQIVPSFKKEIEMDGELIIIYEKVRIDS